MPSVKACPFDPADLVARCREAASVQGFRTESFGECDGVPLVAFTRRATGDCPRVYLSAGVHGDEPAPPLAVLELLQRGTLSNRLNWFIVPLLNPTGFRHGQRANVGGIDLNRDYLRPRSAEVQAHVNWLERQPRFDLALCLHEDWEADGFYLYELNPSQERSLAHLIRSAASRHLPIEKASVIDGRPIDEPGIIRPESDPALRDTWPEAIYIREHHTDLCYTFETPSGRDLTVRVNTQIAAVNVAINSLTLRSRGEDHQGQNA